MWKDIIDFEAWIFNLRICFGGFNSEANLK